jgi:hypothetical protein
MEVRGSVTDRPWGVTLAAIAQRRHTGQLTIESDGRRYGIAFDDGVIVAATSPLAADALSRIALTNHFITSTQVAEVTRRVALSPERDEVEVLAGAIRFSPDQALKLRHRLALQRAARTFSLEHGDFVLEDRIALPVFAGVAIDHRHVIYLGVRTNLSEQRLIDDLRALGSHFVLRPEALEELPRYGFEPSAHPVIEALKVGTSLPELEASHRELDPRSAQAIIYALVSCTACVISPRTTTQQPTAARAATPSPRNRDTPRTVPPAIDAGAQRNQDQAVLAGKAPPMGATVGPATPAVAGTAAPQRELPTAASTTTRPLSLGTRAPFAGATTMAPDPALSEDGPMAPPDVAPSTAPRAEGRTTRSPFASRATTASPTAYSGAATQDTGTNTPAATRPKAQPEPGSSRISTAYAGAATQDTGTNTPPEPGSSRIPTAASGATSAALAARPQTPACPQTPAALPSAAPAPTPATRPRTSTASAAPSGQPSTGSSAGPVTAPTAAAATLRTTAQPPVAPTDTTQPASATRTETDDTVKLTGNPTPSSPSGSTQQHGVMFGGPQSTRAASATATPTSSATSGRPSVARTPTSEADVVRGFTDQRTPSGFLDQHTPGFGEQRTPAERTPTDPAFPRTPGSPTPSRISTDTAVAAEAAFKRGEAAMKRDQPSEAILAYKTACELNPSEVDYAAMLAWAKFCAAADKIAVAGETRKLIERAVFKSQRPERARFYLGRVERMLGRDKEALRHFQEVLEHKPNHADAASEVRAIEARLQAAGKAGTGLFGRKR